mgnify:CR=1 FL=1
MEINEEVLKAILDSYPYEIVFVDLNHTVQYMNAVAKRRYPGRVTVGQSLFNCHNEDSKVKIEKFLERARNGENEMFEVYNTKTGEREFFTPVRNSSGEVIGYFERHEVHWDIDKADEEIGDYWTRRV